VLAIAFPGLYFAETMAARGRPLNGHQLRNRSVPPRPRKSQARYPSSLMNINEPWKSDGLIEHIRTKILKEEKRKVTFSHLFTKFSVLNTN